jgi:methanogenic corrinoid protein MtbC1
MNARTPEETGRPDQRPEADLFEEYFDRLMALAHERMEIEWVSHRRGDLQRLRPDLLEIHREFGALLRVVFRYGLADALREEAIGYAITLTRRNSPHDALALLLDSWIMAIQGLIQPPECNVLAAPLKKLRDDLPGLIREMPPPKSVNPHALELMQRAVAGDLAGARDVLRACLAAGVPPYDVVPDLLLAAMSEIGVRWERNELTIYQEHLATETVVRLLAGLPASVSAAPSIGRKALVSCAPDDHIQLIPMALAVYLELRGWQAASLGQGLPADQIAAAAEALRPDAVFLSLAMVARLSGALETVARLVQLKPRPAVIVGGRGARLARAWLEAAGAGVADTFDEAHRMALGSGGQDA